MNDGLLKQLFDPNYYLSANADVANAGINPLQHYLDFGWKERRNPAQFFSETSYRIRYSLSDDEGAALTHFADNIEDRRFSPHPLIDRGFLLDEFQVDIRIPSEEWLLQLPTAVSLHPIFDLPWMVHTYGDLGGTTLNPCVHFLLWGESEFRNPRANVDVFKIRNQLEALGASAEQLASPLSTYLTYGAVLSIRINDVCDVEWAVAQQLATSPAPDLTVETLSTSCPMIDWEEFLDMSRPHDSIRDQFALAAAGPLEYITAVNHSMSKTVAMSLIDNYYS